MKRYHSTMNARLSFRSRWCSGLASAVVACLLIIAPAALDAQDVSLPQTQHPEAEKAIAVLKSPYCPGLMLEVCTSLQGAALRDSLQVMAEEGGTADELVDWVLANHGEQYLAYPEASGTGLLAWLVPPGAILLGILVVVGTLRYMRGSAPPEETPNAELSEAEEDRLREALRDMDSAEEPVF